VSICAFYLYKYIIEAIGLEKLGLWSLILSVTSLVNIGNFGFTGSLVKFSAELSIKNEFKKINAILNVSIVGISLILAILLSIIYFLGHYFMWYFVDVKWVPTSQNLLFYALLSLYINILASLYFSVLEGLNLAYLRSISFIIATVIYVILPFFHHCHRIVFVTEEITFHFKSPVPRFIM
jgi:O-antigen/teichoic acid export membrane protein